MTTEGLTYAHLYDSHRMAYDVDKEPSSPRAREIYEILGVPDPSTDDYTQALAFINKTRHTVQGPLDPNAAGWTRDDVFAEAKRLGWKAGKRWA
jgi:hypothetical protein